MPAPKVLVDSSVWINHLRIPNQQLQAFLGDGRVVSHPFIIGELALGSLRARKSVIAWLNLLEQLSLASSSEALYFIEEKKLFTCGIGLVDTHLLASCLLEGSTQIWTDDKRLAVVATELDICLVQ